MGMYTTIEIDSIMQVLGSSNRPEVGSSIVNSCLYCLKQPNSTTRVTGRFANGIPGANPTTFEFTATTPA
jgi:hypothetical protein